MFATLGMPTGQPMKFPGYEQKHILNCSLPDDMHVSIGPTEDMEVGIYLTEEETKEVTREWELCQMLVKPLWGLTEGHSGSLQIASQVLYANRGVGEETGWLSEKTGSGNRGLYFEGKFI